MRTGDEAEARRVLDRTYKVFHDVVTFNLLGLLDKLEKFDVVRDGDLVLKFDPKKRRCCASAVPLAHEALKKLSATYQFTPKGPILIEIFPIHDDFAVRNLGLPGLVGALGACFGRVVSMDSPRAKPPGTFSWQATLWHELAHVVTLQMSNQRAALADRRRLSLRRGPREALVAQRDGSSIRPGARARSGAQVARSEFRLTKPDTIALYYQASLLVEHIVATRGQAALNTLVRVYGEGAEGDAAISKGLGISLDELQATFDKMLDARSAPSGRRCGTSRSRPNQAVRLTNGRATLPP